MKLCAISKYNVIFNQIGNGILFSGSGCWSDIYELYNILKHHSRLFEWENLRSIQVEESAYLLSSILYKRRFFPFYSFSMLSGLDNTGSGSIYKYDAVGSWERVRAGCVGKGEKLIQPMLDELSEVDDDLALWQLPLSYQPETKKVGTQTAAGTSINYIRNLTKEKACSIIRSFFQAAAEREISIGDGLDIWIIEYPRIEDTSANQDDVSVHKQFIKNMASSKTRHLIDKRNYKLPTH